MTEREQATTAIPEICSGCGQPLRPIGQRIRSDAGVFHVWCWPRAVGEEPTR